MLRLCTVKYGLGFEVSCIRFWVLACLGFRVWSLGAHIDGANLRNLS